MPIEIRSLDRVKGAHAPEATDPDHHLWRNGRLYWVAFTVHLPGWQKERIRLSLGTDDVHEARQRRDQILAEYPRRRACELSVRIQPGRRGKPAADVIAAPAARAAVAA